MQEKKIRWKTSLLLFSIYLCCFIFLTGCDNAIPPEFDPSPDITPGDISDRLVARIYFDATLSMQGFVVPRSTRYTRMCPYLESVIVSGWREGKVDFFRFGEQVESIDRGTYLQAGHADFYEQENIYRETFIQKIIDYEDQLASNKIEGSTIPEESTEMEVNNIPEESTEIVTPIEEVNESKKEGRLVVIMTDLFQDRGDINLLVTQLKEKYIKKGFEVGLFGLRSQFDGTVYDTGIGQAPLPYRSDPNDLKTFRPFYLLVLGRHADIAHYFDRLIANGFPKEQTIIFSRYLVNSLLSFEDATIKVKNLNSKTLRDNQPPRLKQYEIVDNFKDVAIFTTLKYDPLRYAMSFDATTLKEVPVAKYAPTGEWVENPEAQKSIQVTSTHSSSEDGNELSVDFNLDSRSLPGKAVYFYEVTLRPGIDSYRMPDWCGDWDMGDERNGSKTLNLLNFVRDLTHVTVRRHNPEIAKFYCYIEKR